MDQNDRFVVRFSASKVAAIVGLHEFSDTTKDFLEYLYQDLDELLEEDAKCLTMTALSKDESLDQLLQQIGSELLEKIHEIVFWTRSSAPSTIDAVNDVYLNVDKLILRAQKQNQINPDQVNNLEKLLKEKIRKSFGKKNENLAIKAYERMHGCQVRMSNEKFYFLIFPPLPPSSELLSFYEQIDSYTHKYSVTKGEVCIEFPPGYFSVCGMIDGLTEILHISQEDKWEMIPILVEVKNRLWSFRQTPPLHDQIQVAVYLKMLDLQEGDLVQCLSEDEVRIQVSRISWDTYPLNVSRITLGNKGNLWNSLVVPRLYKYATTIKNFRENKDLRLSYLNGTSKERMDMLKRECDFLSFF